LQRAGVAGAIKKGQKGDRQKGDILLFAGKKQNVPFLLFAPLFTE
jgi:hypothetical protein